jgi:exosortase A-associated hydrolase 1
MRAWLSFEVSGTQCAATLDTGDKDHGLLIVSGGNEIRTGAHRGMANLAAQIAEAGIPVLRFDRRGIGDSEGENAGFEGSAEDIAAAIALFRAECPHLRRITAFGNCDAAMALLLHHAADGPDALLIANPWTIDAVEDGPGTARSKNATALPPPTAIRARYAAKLRDPAEWKRLLAGGVNLRKLLRGLIAARRTAPARLAERMAIAMHDMADTDITILIAERDSTAQAFVAAWQSPLFDSARRSGRVTTHTCPTASHSFADTASRQWFINRVLEALQN